MSTSETGGLRISAISPAVIACFGDSLISSTRHFALSFTSISSIAILASSKAMYLASNHVMLWNRIENVP